MLTPAEKVANNIHPDHSHKWTVAVRSATSKDDQMGGADDITHFIKRVAFKLHDSFPNPNRSKRVTLPYTTVSDILYYKVLDKPPFEVSETGCVRAVPFVARLLISPAVGVNSKSKSA